jgi:anti-sigma factor RsiW
MTTSFDCERTLLVQADFDGELSAAEAAAAFQHERQCSHCQRAREQLTRSRELMRAVPRFEASPELRASLQRRSLAARADTSAASPGEAERRRGDDRGRSPGARWFSRPATLGWSAALAASAVLALVLILPVRPQIGSQLVANHLRAMQLDSHLIDVASSDHHTVKPWFAGKVSFVPLVKELAADGYVLKGGRIDIVQGAPAAVLVYGAGRHVLDVYMWPASAAANGGLRAPTAIAGFEMRHWEEGELTLWCVSDMGADEMDRFVDKWRAR